MKNPIDPIVVIHLVLATSAVLIAGGCGAPDGYEEVRVASTQSALFNPPNYPLWSGPVDVCWIDPAAADAQKRQWVQDLAYRSWSFVGDVEFVGWGDCSNWSSSHEGLRIRTGNHLNGANGFGANLALENPALTLNFRFDDFETFFRAGQPELSMHYSSVVTCDDMMETDELASGFDDTRDQLRACVEGFALHEFGHVLGYGHELIPAGSASELVERCEEIGSFVQQGEVPAGVYNDEWDTNSVMNLCNPKYLGNHLSALDVAGHQDLYGLGPRYVAAVVATVL